MHQRGSAGCRGPPIEPGRRARVTNLADRNDLNGQLCEIKHMIPNGSWACEFVHLRETDFERTELVSIPRENLETVWNMPENIIESTCMEELGECPICLDTQMQRSNAWPKNCCGGWVCKPCGIKMHKMNTCPLCRGDTIDHGSSLENKLLARAKRGDPRAMHNLAGRYDLGKDGFRHDQALARVWYQRAAEKGYFRSAHDLACSHRDGEGGPVDLAMAAKYFRQAAEKGHIPACTNLGIALMRGDGVNMDEDEARKWLKKGADANDELAIRQLKLLDRGYSRGMPFRFGSGMMMGM